MAVVSVGVFIVFFFPPLFFLKTSINPYPPPPSPPFILSFWCLSISTFYSQIRLKRRAIFTHLNSHHSCLSFIFCNNRKRWLNAAVSIFLFRYANTQTRPQLVKKDTVFLILFVFVRKKNKKNPFVQLVVVDCFLVNEKLWWWWWWWIWMKTKTQWEKRERLAAHSRSGRLVFKKVCPSSGWWMR